MDPFNVSDEWELPEEDWFNDIVAAVVVGWYYIEISEAQR